MTGGDGGAGPRDHVHLFIYGTLRVGIRGDTAPRAHPRRASAPAVRDLGADRSAGSGLLDGCAHVRTATVRGTLYHLDAYPALVLAGADAVAGEVWRAPAGLLLRLDAHEDVAGGLFRRVAVDVDGLACWTYVAGPALARRLTPGRRIASGEWTPAAPHRTT